MLPKPETLAHRQSHSATSEPREGPARKPRQARRAGSSPPSSRLFRKSETSRSMDQPWPSPTFPPCPGTPCLVGARAARNRRPFPCFRKRHGTPPRNEAGSSLSERPRSTRPPSCVFSGAVLAVPERAISSSLPWKATFLEDALLAKDRHWWLASWGSEGSCGLEAGGPV